MRDRLKQIVIGIATIAVLAAGGAAIAGAAGGEDEAADEATEAAERVAGDEADRAAAAAVEAVGGGEALEVEQADDGATGFEVEVSKPDGSTVEVNLDPAMKVVSTESDD